MREPMSIHRTIVQHNKWRGVPSEYLVTLGIIIVVVVSAVAITITLSDLIKYAPMDLRNRIVGARAILEGLNPYDTTWNPLSHPSLADFWQHYPGVSKVTATPVVLLLYIPFAYVDYQYQQAIWWGLQWLALGVSIALLTKIIKDERKKGIFLAFIAFALIWSWGWRLHVGRSQYYIFVTMLICIDIFLLSINPKHKLVGIASGLAVAFRPNNVVLIPLLWLMGERSAAWKAAITASSLFLMTLFLVGWPAWEKWLEMASIWGLMEVYGFDYQSKIFGPISVFSPVIIENVDFRQYLFYSSRSSDIIGLIGREFAITLGLWTTLGVSFGACAFIWWLKRNRPHLSRDALLLVIVTTLVLIDFLRPARYVYCDVAFLPVFALLISLLPSQRWFIAMFSVVFMLYIPPWKDAPLEFELLKNACVIVLTLLLLVYSIRIRPPQRVET